MTFGYGTREFEVTTERLGCYRPEDHIDNPKDYADNIDATQYDRRLRGPVDERVELAIDETRGLKNYIANEEIGITTSAGHVRDLFTRCVRLGRSYARGNNEDELFEALRLLGTGLHCLEDWSAHSNYTELTLIEMGERDIFPLVGRNTKIRLPGARSSVYPIVTGTFGGVDFLHSVMGEFNDKATQSEIQQLEGTMQNGTNADTSFLKEILSKIPDGLLGGDDEGSKADKLRINATTAQMNQTRVSPREPEAFTRQMQEYVKNIYPIMEWHDDIMKKISSAIDKIPILPELIEQLEDQINIFVFGLLAPFVLPLIEQLKTELNTGSSEIIQSSNDKQLNVFYDDASTDPTHSMLAKDHFSNILNEPAGKIASQVLKWAVPQIIRCWDNEDEDVDRVCTRIINGVFHHPAVRDQGEDGASECRQQMFGIVESWWNEKSSSEQRELRQKLSREGVQNGENHKEGVEDSGHGCGKPIGMAKSSCGEGAGGGMITDLVSALGGGNFAAAAGSGYGRPLASSHLEKLAAEAAGGGAFGGIVGAIAGGLAGDFLGGSFGEEEKKKSSTKYKSYEGEETNEYSEYGSEDKKYKRHDESRIEHSSSGYEQHGESRNTYGGEYEEQSQRSYGRGNEVTTEEWRQERSSEGNEYESERKSKEYKKEKKYRNKESEDEEEDEDDGDESNDSDYKRRKKEKKEQKKREKYAKEQREKESRGGYGGDQQREQEGYGGGYQQREQTAYGGGYQQTEQEGYAGGYQQREQEGYAGGYQQREQEGYGGGAYQQREQEGYGGGAYQQREQEGYGGGAYQQREQEGYGGGRPRSRGEHRRDDSDDERRGDRGYGGDRGY